MTAQDLEEEDEGLEGVDWPRRLRALRILCGFPTQAEFAKALDRKGLGYDTLALVERGERGLTLAEAEDICAFCGVASGWFYVPLGYLGRMEDAPPRDTIYLRIERRLERIEADQGLVLAGVNALEPVKDLFSATDEARQGGGAPTPPARQD